MINILYIFFLKLKFTNRITFGHNVKISFLSNIDITDQASVIFSDNTVIKANTEIRAHQNSKVLIGKNVKLDNGVRIVASNTAFVSIKNNTKIGFYSVLNAGDSISIGEKCLISGFVYIQTSMHKHKVEKDIQDQGFDHGRIEIGSDAWIGTHVTIMPGIIIGKGSIVGSNSVVTKNIHKNEIWAGVPALLLKERK